MHALFDTDLLDVHQCVHAHKMGGFSTDSLSFLYFPYKTNIPHSVVSHEVSETF